jgi:hypothetical protein
VTNVVGFLIIVLIVVQLNMEEAAKRLMEQKEPEPAVAPTTPAVDPTAKLSAEVLELRARLAALLNQISERKKEAEAKRPADQVQQQREDLQQLLRKLNEEKEKIENQINSARARLAGLQQRIKEAQDRPALTGPEEMLTGLAIVEGSGTTSAQTWEKRPSVDFVCRRGRVYRIDGSGLVRRYKSAMQRCLGKTSNFSSSDVIRLQSFLDRNQVQDKYFRIKVEMTGTLFFPVFEFLSDVQGETTQQLQAERSEHDRELSKVNRSTAWVMYYVCDDSFETFLAALSMAKKRYRLRIGWRPWSSTIRRVSGGGGGGGAPAAPQY